MGEVAKQFTQLKFSIDTLSAQGQPYISISNPITLGSEEMPFLASSRAYGNINIKSDSFKVTFNNSNCEEEIHLGSIEYSSSNSYYLDKSYIFESGALILSQARGNIMIINPQFIVVNDNEIIFNLVKIIESGETSVSGYGTCPIQTEFVQSTPLLLNDDVNQLNYVEKINITTEHKKAWKKMLEDTLPDDSEDLLNYTITEYDDGVELKFIQDTSPEVADIYPRISSNIVEIKVKISQTLK